jgi:hypothetical protein
LGSTATGDDSDEVNGVAGDVNEEMVVSESSPDRREDDEEETERRSGAV